VIQAGDEVAVVGAAVLRLGREGLELAAEALKTESRRPSGWRTKTASV
jgi:hypothetical protein